VVFISVVIPTFNEEKYIEGTLRALKEQDYDEEFEVIIGDSYSTDRTVELAQSYGARVTCMEKRSPGAGRNAGARAARGDVLLFLDADTVPSRNLLRVFDQAFREDERLIAATCRVYPSIDSGVTVLGAVFLNDFFVRLSIFLGQGFFPGICFACRKGVFESIGGYREDLKVAEDLEFSSRLSQVKGKFKFITETYVVTSTRRYEKWGIERVLKAWPFGYVCLKLKTRLPDYEPVR